MLAIIAIRFVCKRLWTSASRPAENTLKLNISVCWWAAPKSARHQPISSSVILHFRIVFARSAPKYAKPAPQIAEGSAIWTNASGPVKTAPKVAGKWRAFSTKVISRKEYPGVTHFLFITKTWSTRRKNINIRVFVVIKDFNGLSCLINLPVNTVRG